MKAFQRIIGILTILSMFSSNVAVPLAQAAESSLAPITAPSTQQQPVNNLLASNTPVKALGSTAFNLTERQRAAATNYTHTSIRVQKLAKKVYKADESIAVAILNPDQEQFQTAIVDGQGKPADVALQQSTDGSQTNLQIESTNQFKPGKYTVTITDEDGTNTKQDFTWGVLALNPDQAVYKPNDTADIGMAVLDDNGKMVCDASVQLRIQNAAQHIDDQYSTDNGRIKVNKECTSTALTINPDYETTYHLAGVGDYTLTLTAQTKNGTRTISDTVSVKNSTPFIIKRSSATRIYPPLTYPMHIDVTADHDFSGTVTETVPASFTITSTDEANNSAPQTGTAADQANTSAPPTPTPDPGANTYNNVQTVYLDNQQNPEMNLQASVLGASTSALVMPFDGNYQITQGFGTDLTDVPLRNFYAQYGLAGHDGIDFGLPMGTPLYAVDDGNILEAGPGDYGTTIIIQHSWGRSYYGHLSVVKVSPNTSVKKGSLIGYSGNTGESTGPHLHFGMKPNNPDMNNGFAGKVNPLLYLPLQGTHPDALAAATPVQPQTVLGASTSKAQESSASTQTPDQAFTMQEQQLTKKAAEDANTTTEKVKVLTWNVNLKKGEKTTLTYYYKTPQVSPQFYTVGPLKLYQNGGSQVFDEGRSWQIAADAIGVDWYDYNWQYRKQITLDHTKVGSPTSAPIEDAASFAQSSGVSAISWNHTTANVNNRILIVGVSSQNTTVQTVSSVKYNGVALTAVTGGGVSCSALCRSDLFYMINPPAGTFQVLVTLNGTASTGVVGGAATFDNVDTTNPFGTAATAIATSTAPSVTVTTAVPTLGPQLVIGIVGAQNSGSMPNDGVGVVQLWHTTTFSISGGDYAQATGTSTTLSHTLSGSQPWSMVGVPLNGLYNDNTAAPAVRFMESGTDATQGFGIYNGTSGSVSSSTTQTHTGPRVIDFSTGAGGSAAIVHTPVGSVADSGSRIDFWIYYANFPSSTTTSDIVEVYNAADSSQVFSALTLNTNHTVTLLNGAGGQGAGTTVLATGQWYRFTLTYAATRLQTGAYSAKFYINGNLDSAVINQIPGGGASGASLLRFGIVDGTLSANAHVYIDDLYIDSGTDLSDPGDVRVTAKRPFSAGASNAFGTQIGAGGSGYGSGHAPQVNERPSSATNGWTSSAISQRENYTLEGASVGDVDVSAKTVLGTEAWVSAHSSAGCATASLTNDGTDSTLSLTTTETVYYKTNTTSTYPSTNQGVGIQACSAGTSSITEGGMLVAYITPRTSLTNFPVLISVTDANLAAHAQSGGTAGNDILFTDSTGRTKLSHQIESYTSGTGALVAWVNIPTLSVSSDTTIYMYYGNPTAASQQNATAVWDSNYKSVYHLKESGTCSSTDFLDSTTNGNWGVGDCPIAKTPVAGTGEIGTGQIFTASSSQAFTGTTQSILNGTGAMTIEFWVKPTACTANGYSIVKQVANVQPNSIEVDYCDATNDIELWEGSGNLAETQNNVVSTGSWHHVVVVATAAGGVQIYVDGSAVGLVDSTVSPAASDGPLDIGKDKASGSTMYLDGGLDEVRLSQTNRSSDWVGTEYNNDTYPSDFETFGSEETKIYAPTNDRLMRHGKYFNTVGVEQPFVF